MKVMVESLDHSLDRNEVIAVVVIRYPLRPMKPERLDGEGWPEPSKDDLPGYVKAWGDRKSRFDAEMKEYEREMLVYEEAMRESRLLHLGPALLEQPGLKDEGGF